MGLRYFTPSSVGYTNKRSLSLASASSQYANMGTLLSVNTANSISAWFKMTAGNNLDQTIVCQEWRNGSDTPVSPFGTFSIELVTDGSGNGTMYGYYWSNASAAIYLGRSVAFTTGAWHHVVLMYDGVSVATMYIDGSSAGTADFHSGTWVSLNLNGKNIFVGARQRSTTPNQYFNGLVDNVSLWNAALTSGQVTTVYNAGHPGDLTKTSFFANCTHWWPIGEYADTTTTLYDRRTGVTGTTVNSPTFSATIP